MAATVSTASARGLLRVVALPAAVTISEPLAQSMFLVALPLIRADLDLDFSSMGLIASAFGWTLLVCQPLYGLTVARWGTRRTLLVTLSVLCLGSLGLTTASSVPAFIFWRALQGAGAGAGVVAAVAGIGARVSGLHAGRATSLFQGVSAVGPILGFAAGSILVTQGWRGHAFALMAWAGVMALIAVRAFPDSPGVRARGNPFSALFRNPRVTAVSILTFGQGCTLFALMSFVPQIYTGRFGMAPWAAAILVLAGDLPRVVTSLISGRFDSDRALLVGTVWVGLAAPLIVVAALVDWLPALFLAQWLIGVGIGLGWPAHLAVLARLSAAERPGATGAYAMARYGGFALGPALFGLGAGYLGPQLAFGPTSTTSVLALAALALLLQQRALQERSQPSK